VAWIKLHEAIQGPLEDVKRRSGVYLVRWAGREKGIARMKGQDPKSTLYIGFGKNLGRRIRSLWRKFMEPKSRARHTMVDTLVYCSLVETIRSEELEIAWVPFGSESEALAQEWAGIRFYTERYGEPPPLNLSVGRKRFAIAGLAEIGKSKVVSPVKEELRSLIDP